MSTVDDTTTFAIVVPDPAIHATPFRNKGSFCDCNKKLFVAFDPMTTNVTERLGNRGALEGSGITKAETLGVVVAVNDLVTV